MRQGTQTESRIRNASQNRPQALFPLVDPNQRKFLSLESTLAELRQANSNAACANTIVSSGDYRRSRDP
ncbi:hypothetical protein [Desulfosporosinus sp. BG]|uniref:hypothetical protein n=1 Tax=Desulfosporosinus sp. BG TaxID=1633135 RepID=UPI00114CBDA3|nr:hypothetical protein [Desulfosporosinus sp. BG]